MPRRRSFEERLPVSHREILARSKNFIGVKINQTACIKGHPLSGLNLYVTPDGRRQCRQCAARRQEAFHARSQ